MPRFHYQASNPQGETVSGNHQAEDAVQVRDYLRTQHLFPISVTEEKEAAWNWGKGRWSLSERVIWMQQLAAALEARLPLLEALGILVQQSAEASQARKVTQAIYSAVQGGQPLDYALNEYSRYFDRMTITVVRSGIESGKLPQFLTDLAKDWEAQQILRQKVMAAMLYPALVGGVSLLMTTGLLFYLTPTLENLFAKRWDQLPWITRFMVALGKILREYGWVLLLMIGGFIAWLPRLLKRPGVQVKLQQLILKTPWVGVLSVGLDSARMANTLGILVASGIPLLKAIVIARPAVKLFTLSDALGRIHERVQQGGSLGRAFKEENLFPSTLVHWIESGERSGELADRLKQAAKQLQMDAERRIMVFTSILEPILILGTGCIVLVLVLSILLPMTSIQQLVK
ncbi:MAG: type II secretion system F family protein [Pseudomonadota bacterium]